MKVLLQSFALAFSLCVSNQIFACGHIQDTHFITVDSGDTLAVWTSASPCGVRSIQAGIVDNKEKNDFPVTLSQPEMNAFHPCVASTKDGSFIVAWMAIDKELGLYRIYYTTLTPGRSWSIPKPLSREIDNVEHFYGVETNGKGKVIAKWRALNMEDSKGYIVVGTHNGRDKWECSQFFFRD